MSVLNINFLLLLIGLTTVLYVKVKAQSTSISFACSYPKSVALDPATGNALFTCSDFVPNYFTYPGFPSGSAFMVTPSGASTQILTLEQCAIPNAGIVVNGMAYVACGSPAVAGGLDAGAGVIVVNFAIYGSNCINYSDRTYQFSSCEGQVYCSVTFATLTDPDFGCAKNLIVSYSCNRQGSVQGQPQIVIPGEADKAQVIMNCAAIVSSAIVSVSVTGGPASVFYNCLAYALAYDAANNAIIAACDSGVVSVQLYGTSAITLCSSCALYVYSPLYNQEMGLLVDTNTSSVYMSSSMGVLLFSTAVNDIQDDYIVLANNGQASGLAFDEQSKTLFFSVYYQGVFALSLETRQQKVFLPESSCGRATALQYDQTSDRLFVSCLSGSVVSVQVSTSITSVLIPASTCGAGSALAYSSSTATLFAACTSSASQIVSGLSVVNLISESATSIALDSRSSTVFLATALSGVIGISGSTQSSYMSSHQCQTVSSLSYDATFGMLFIACSSNNAVYRLQSETASSSATSRLSSSLTPVNVPFVLVSCSSPSSLTFVQSSSLSSNYTSFLIVGCNSGLWIVHNPSSSNNASITQLARLHVASVDFDEKTNLIIFSTSYEIFTISLTGSTLNMIYQGEAEQIFVNSVTSVVYVLQVESQKVLGVSLVNGVVLYQLQAGILSNPISLFFDPFTQLVYIGCDYRCTLQVSSELSNGSYLSPCMMPVVAISFDDNSELFVLSGTGEVSLVGSGKCPGGYGFKFGFGCSFCAVGTASSPSSYLLPGPYRVCLACLAGYIAASPGQVRCDACPNGQYSSPSRTLCSDCLPGVYGNGPSSNASCTSPCPAGHFCPAGTANPLQCGAPSVYCPKGSSTASSALPGQETIGGDEITRSSVMPCPTGYSCIGGQKQPCLPGTFTNATGSSVCSSCFPGTFSTAAASSCISCQVGTYESHNVECNPCSPGLFSSGVAATSCSACALGRFAAGTGATTCQNCSIGMYAPAAGGSLCYNCNQGYIAATVGLSMCSPCLAGTMSASNAANCVPCPAGSIAAVSGSATCLPCTLGSISNVSGSSVCLPCPAGRSSGPSLGSSSCSECSPGSIAQHELTVECSTCSAGTYVLSAGATVCQSCSTGLECVKGNVTVMVGYFAYTTPDNLIAVVPCPASKCIGGPIGTCAENRVQQQSNFLCGSCLDGYSDVSGNCFPCDAPNQTLIAVLLICSLFYVLMLHISAQKQDMDPLPIFMYFIQVVLLVVGPLDAFMGWLSFFGLSTSSSSSSGSSSTDYCLVPVSGVSAIALGFVEPLIFLAQLVIIAIITMILKPCLCSQQRQPEDDTIIPNVSVSTRDTSVDPKTGSVPDVNDNANNAGKPARRCGFVFDMLATLPVSVDSFVRSFVSLLLFSYTAISSLVFSWFQCVSVSDSISVLYSQSAVQCGSTEYNAFSPVVYVVLVLYVIGLPVSIIAFLVYSRENIRVYYENRSQKKQSTRSYTAAKLFASPAVSTLPSSSSSSSSSLSIKSWLRSVFDAIVPSVPLPSHLSFASRYGLLFQAYRHSYYMWNAFIIGRRSIASAFATALYNSTSARALAMFLLHFVALITHLHTLPYKHDINNRLETASLSALTIISAIISAYQTPPYPYLVQVFVCLIIAVMLAIGASAVAGATWYVKQKEKVTKAYNDLVSVEMRDVRRPTLDPDDELFENSQMSINDRD